MLYGNIHTRLSGIIKELQQNRAKIEFPTCNHKQLSVPWNFIHSQIQRVLNQPQEMEIETWFLKKNRIIPLNDYKNMRE